jgi:signal peptidase II
MWAVAVIILILVIDQVLKIFVKTNFRLGEMRQICGVDWANLYFVENEGMAFGLDIAGGTILLCSFRIIAVALLVIFLIRIIKSNFPSAFILCICLVLAGAAGNIFDNIFYGAFFTESTPWRVATNVPFNEGYSTLFVGKVVDMFYFPVIRTVYPDWVPVLGGQQFVFFSPIFNFADAAITSGTLAVILFYRKTSQRAYMLFEHKKESTDDV